MDKIDKKRVAWLDNAKFFGIFLIYLGHLCNYAGRSYQYAFAFHVEFFFFLSGCSENFSNKTFLQTVKTVLRNILIPWFIFGIISMLVYILRVEPDFVSISNSFKVLILGCTRNYFIASSLWFLTCLAIIRVCFWFIKKFKSKLVILAVSLIISIGCFRIITGNKYPFGVYNWDSAILYMVYYALGYILFPYINKLFSDNRIITRIILNISFWICLIYSASVFMGMDLFYPLLKLVAAVNLQLYDIVCLIKVMMMGWVYIIISYRIGESNIMNYIGRNTLYICGNEMIIKDLFPCLLSVFGLEVIFSNPLTSYIYTGILILLSTYLLMPISVRIIRYFQYGFDNIINSISNSKEV